MFKNISLLFSISVLLLSACGTWEVTIEQAPTPIPAQASPIVVTATPTTRRL